MPVRIAIFYRELVRRNVIKIGVLYVLGSWALVEASGEIIPMLGLPPSISSVALLVAIAGLPVALLLAWFFQFSRQGVIRTVPFQERRYHERRQQNISVSCENRKGERRATHFLMRVANEHSLRESGFLEQPVWLLKALDDVIAGNTYPITKRITMGRDQGCDITLPDTTVSRRHTELTAGHEGILVRDLGAPNGTFINDVRVETEARARHADIVRLSRMRFEVVAPNVDVLRTVHIDTGDTPDAS